MALNTVPPHTHPEDSFPKETWHDKSIQVASKGWRKWVTITFLTTILATSLGVGLPLGLRKSPGSSPANIPNTTSSPSAPPLNHGAANDTSLAAISTADDNRHVFFQDIDGTLRLTTFAPSTNTWIFAKDFLQTTAQPRDHSPLAVLSANTTVYASLLNLFYVDSQNSLAGISVSLDGKTDGTNIMNGSFPTALNSRSLSVSQLTTNELGVNNGSSIVTGESLLLYESPQGTVSALHGQLSSTDLRSGIITAPANWTRQNVTELFSSQTLSEGDSDGFRAFQLGSPFAASAPTQRPASNFVLATFFNTQDLSDLYLARLITIKTYNLTGPGT